MKVVCNDIEELIVVISHEIGTGGQLIGGRVHIEKNEVEVNEFKREVWAAGTAVVQNEEISYLVEVADRCGFDYRDGDQENHGTEEFKVKKDRIMRFAGEHGFSVLPGRMEL